MIADELTDRLQSIITTTACHWCNKGKLVKHEEKQWFDSNKKRATTYKWLSCPICYYVIDLGIKTEDYKK